MDGWIECSDTNRQIDEIFISFSPHKNMPAEIQLMNRLMADRSYFLFNK